MTKERSQSSRVRTSNTQLNIKVFGLHRMRLSAVLFEVKTADNLEDASRLANRSFKIARRSQLTVGEVVGTGVGTGVGCCSTQKGRAERTNAAELVSAIHTHISIMS
jgi:hypothetical protein